MTTPEQLEKEAAEFGDWFRHAHDHAATTLWLDSAERIKAALDQAIAGWKGTQEAFNLMMDARVEVSTGEAEVMRGERDAARELADRLAGAIFPDSNDEAADEQERNAALAAYEARGW